MNSGFRLRPGDQPLPLPCGPGEMGAHDYLIDELNDMSMPEVLRAEASSFIYSRRQLGLDRYGQILHPNNGRDQVRDAVEEAGDLLAYMSNLKRLGLIAERSYHITWVVFLDLIRIYRNLDVPPPDFLLGG